MEDKFEELIKRYQAGTCAEHERKLVEDWLENRAKDDLFNELPLPEQERMLETVSDSLLARIDPSTNSRMRQRAIVWWMPAAAILLLSLSYYLLWQRPRTTRPHEEMALHAVSSSPIYKIILSDGSIIWLKGNSTLDYPETFTGGERRVSLNGEALFEIAKDPRHPFIVQCGDLSARVLGTSFNIKKEGRSIEVKVLTGRVSLSTVKDKNRPLLVLAANEKAVFDEKQEKVVSDGLKREESAKAVQGTEYSMDFKDTPMREIIKRVEGKFNVSVIMQNARLGNCRITADLTDQSLESTLIMISKVLRLEYNMQKSTILLTGEGCGV